MVQIPKNDPIKHELNDRLIESLCRPYVGLSQAGHSCHRFLQHYHYWTFKEWHSVRLKRLFNVGHNAEAEMKASLADVGINTYGDQTEIIGVTGHWKGHIDDLGTEDSNPDEEFLVEYKTHNDKSFKDLKKKKMKLSKPTHWEQMNNYMGYLGLSKGLYFAMNKNDSEYYYEWVDFDADAFKEGKRKQVEIIASDTMLPRIGNDSPTWFECKFCSASQVCFGAEEPLKSCRTCSWVDILPDGEWACSNLMDAPKHLTEEEQRKGCEHYELGEMFNVRD